MHYHIILTERCNLRCKYCYEKSMQEFDNGLDKKWDYNLKDPFDSEVKIEKLKKLIKPDDTLIFYGGEPLIKMNKIMEIMDNLNCKFGIQTNGILLKKLPTKYLLKIDKMLVSIDGDKKRTNFNRGFGKYTLILENIKDARRRGYKGEIVARMTLSFPDIFKQVNHLVSLINEGIFDSIHWQIDAGFYKNDFEFKKFLRFVEEYNLSIEKLLEWWVEKMGGGKVYKLYPFLGIFNRLIGKDKEKRLPCGSGYSNFTITTSGKLSACPIMNSIKNFYCGSLENGIEKEIKIKDERCERCSVFEICGGRCLYWREAKLWPREGDELICKTIIYLIKSLERKIPQIKKLINSGRISEEDFDFEKYFGPEIIP